MSNRLDARNDFVRRYGIPGQWREVSLGEIAEVIGGGTPSREEGRYWQGGDIAWATPTDLTALAGKYLNSTSERITQTGLHESAATLLPRGSVLYTSRATIGAKAIAAIEVATNQGFASFVPHNVNGEYLYYLLELLTPIIKRLGAGTTFDEVSKRDIRKVRCALPASQDEQAAIVCVLDAVDAAIDRAQEAGDAACEALVSVIQSLVAACASTYKSQSLGDLILEGPTNGLYRPESDYGQKGTPIVRIDSFDNGSITNLQGLRRVVVPSVIRERFALKQGDVLINRVNALTHVGKAAVVPELSEPTLFESNMMRLRCAEALVPEYLGVILRSDIARRHWLARAKPAVNQVSVNQRDTKSLCLPLPDPDRQREIAQSVHAADALVLCCQERISTLQSLKKSLMHDLLTGTVRVDPAILQEQQA